MWLKATCLHSALALSQGEAASQGLGCRRDAGRIVGYGNSDSLPEEYDLILFGSTRRTYAREN